MNSKYWLAAVFAGSLSVVAGAVVAETSAVIVGPAQLSKPTCANGRSPFVLLKPSSEWNVARKTEGLTDVQVYVLAGTDDAWEVKARGRVGVGPWIALDPTGVQVDVGCRPQQL